MEQVGTIRELWRYPVKSMRGERLEHSVIGEKGVKGDRGWAVRDDTVLEIRSGREMPGLLNCSARYPSEPGEEPYPAAEITLPDGSRVMSDAGDINQRLSDLVGKAVSVWPIVSPDNAEHYQRLPVDEAELRRLFAREPDEPLPDMAQFPEILMNHVSIPGTYFDVTPLHLLTTSTLAFLRDKNPDSDWSTLRFRPNLVIDTGEEPELVENNWIGKCLRIGDLELMCEAPAPRCAITAHPQGDAVAKDPKILRTIVREANQNLGIYCHIRKAGTVHSGDEVSLMA